MGKILSFFQTGDNVDKETLSNERKKQFELRVQHRYEQENLSTTNKQLTKDQKTALALLESGENIFLTGGAGTGKSFLLKKFIATHSELNILVTAPTGVAAKNIDGATLHKTFRLPLGIISKEIDGNGLLENEKYRKKLLKYADIIVIDEISMCRADIFAYIADLILEQYSQGHRLQVVLCGDFFQLPPVISSSEKESFSYVFPENKNGWPFLTTQWKELGIKTVDLKEIVRQKDKQFSEALNEIRKGNIQGVKFLNNNYCKEEIENSVCICGTNSQATSINESRLDLIESQAVTYDIKKEGDVKESDISCEEHLTLKVGARVIILVNDRTGDLYQNGSYATVTALKDNSINVILDNSYSDIEIPINTWEIYGYSYDEITEKIKKTVIGKYQQIPVRLGWAVTVHKSQGSTFSSVNINSKRFWVPGQLYVALSRCRTIERMHLSHPLSEQDIMVFTDVMKYFSNS